MCGICVIKVDQETSGNRHSLSHRGPDQHVDALCSGWMWSFDRLAINGVENGEQPFKNDRSIFFCNGEIYNHHSLQEAFKIPTTTQSDCECIFRVLDQGVDIETLYDKIDGEFAFAFMRDTHMIVARDHFGVRPLFVATDRMGKIVGFASEAKSLTHVQNCHIEQFPPGEAWKIDTETNVVDKYDFKTRSPKVLSTADTSVIRALLINAVQKRLMSEKPVGYFLSGGLDSSIIAAIAANLSTTPITTYSIGMKGSDSADIVAARKVAAHLNTNHVEVEFEAIEAIQALPDIVRQLESYDCTTIRASVPMFLLCREIARRGQHQVMLSGEGADELFGGYLYLHGSPSSEAFQSETERLLACIHQYDGLRADRCTAAHGLELRVPFLDKQFTDYVIGVNASEKIPNSVNMEKMILRDAFKAFLPSEIIYRQKNGMSDAVGTQWIDYIKAHVSTLILKPLVNISRNAPLTNEEHWYRQLYIQWYKNVISHQSIWRPKWTIETDPSARNLPCFVANQ